MTIKKTVFDKHREEFKDEIDYHRYWKDLYEKERKLRQEAEGDNQNNKFIDDREITRLIKALETIAEKMRKWV